jgi:LDH2 family malate/lactate/ureidoglycolate dehydrogenase
MHMHNHTHTPGPWATDTNGLITAGPRRLHIAQTAVTGMGRAAELNAYALAAAPEMLQALKLALLSMERAAMQMGIDPAMDTECSIIRAAITKATTGA